MDGLSLSAPAPPSFFCPTPLDVWTACQRIFNIKSRTLWMAAKGRANIYVWNLPNWLQRLRWLPLAVKELRTLHSFILGILVNSTYKVQFKSTFVTPSFFISKYSFSLITADCCVLIMNFCFRVVESFEQLYFLFANMVRRQKREDVTNCYF